MGSEREIKSLLVEKESLRHKLCDFENHCVKLEAEKKELVAEKNSNHTNQVKLAELVSDMKFIHLMLIFHFSKLPLQLKFKIWSGQSFNCQKNLKASKRS